MLRVEPRLERVPLTSLSVGLPIPWALFDGEGQLILPKGNKVATRRELQELAERGLFRKIYPRPDDAELSEERKRQLAEAEALKYQVACPFADINPRIGATIRLESLGTGEQYAARLVGFLEEQSIIVTNPSQDGKLVSFQPGQAFQVRLMAGRHVYQFRTTLLQTSTQVFAHLHLAYPRQVQGASRRQGVRAELSIICNATNEGGRRIAGMLQDMSVGGARLVTREEFAELNSQVEVSFKLQFQGCEAVLELPATVRSVRLGENPDTNQPEFWHGLQFHHETSETEVLLTAYVYFNLLLGEG